MPTSYKVFRQSDREGGPAYEPVGVFEAHSAKSAMRLAAEKLGAEAHDVTFGATPESSWAEQTVKVSTETRFLFS